MGITGGEYDGFLVLGLGAKSLWLTSRWKLLARNLAPLVMAARGSATFTTFQERAGLTARHPKMGWNNPAWTHKARDEREFFSLDLYAPAKAVCTKQDVGPEVLFHLHAADSALAYDQCAFLAVSRTLPSDLLVHARDVVAPALAALVGARFSARTKRPLRFGRPALARSPAVIGADGFAFSGIAKRAANARRLPTLSELKGGWETF